MEIYGKLYSTSSILSISASSSSICHVIPVDLCPLELDDMIARETFRSTKLAKRKIVT